MTRFAVPRFVLILFAIIGAMWLIEHLFSLVYRIADVLLLFGLAWLLTLLLEPLIRRLGRFGIPRGIAIIIAYLLTVGGLIGGVLALAPQFSSLSRNIPALVQVIAARAEDAAIWLQQRGFEIDPRALTNQIIGLGGQFGSRVATRIVFFAQSVLGVIGRVALVITISVFMSLMSGRMTNVLRPVVPPRWRDEYDAFVQDVNDAYSSYIRGFFYIVALGTFLSGFLLFSFKAPNPIIWLIFIFLLRLLPFLGGTLANVLFILVVFVGIPFPNAIIATIVLMVGQLILTNVLMPRVMGRELGINPLLVSVRRADRRQDLRRRGHPVCHSRRSRDRHVHRQIRETLPAPCIREAGLVDPGSRSWGALHDAISRRCGCSDRSTQRPSSDSPGKAIAANMIWDGLLRV